MSKLTKQELEHLADLARINLTPEEEGRFEHDFDKILHHFTELQELPARSQANLRPRRVVLREDTESSHEFKNKEEIKKQFPRRVGDHLSIPPIFDRD